MKNIIDFIDEHILENSQIDSNKSLLDQGYLLDKIHIHGFQYINFNRAVDLSAYAQELKDKKIDHPSRGWWAEISTGQGKHIGNNYSATFTVKRDLKYDSLNTIYLAPIVYCLLCENNGIEKISDLCADKIYSVENTVKGKQIIITITESYHSGSAKGDHYVKFTFKK